MSDPLAWNGSTFKRPKFWTGTEWKEYVDPVYNIPVLNSEFTSGWEGWTTGGEEPTHNAAEGYVSSWGYDTFIWGGTNYASPRDPGISVELAGQGGHQVDIRMLYRARPYPGAEQRQYIGTMVCDIQAPWPITGLQLKLQDFDWISDGVWRWVQSPPGALPYTPRNSLCQITASADWNMSAMGGGQPSTYIDLSHFVLFDITANQPLMGLGVALWEPYVYRTDGKWK